VIYPARSSFIGSGVLGTSQDCLGQKVTFVTVNATFVTSKVTSEVRHCANDRPEGKSNPPVEYPVSLSIAALHEAWVHPYAVFKNPRTSLSDLL
jgi:hypothetical protein